MLRAVLGACREKALRRHTLGPCDEYNSRAASGAYHLIPFNEHARAARAQTRLKSIFSTGVQSDTSGFDGTCLVFLAARAEISAAAVRRRKERKAQPS